MNQPQPGARPPRFLFSFSTPRAAGRSAAPSPQLSGNTPPHAPLGPRRCLAPPQPPYEKIPNCESLSVPPAASFPLGSAPAAPPPPRAIPPRSWAPLALKRSRGGASACVCGAAVGLSVRGERRKTRRGAPAARRPGSGPPRGSGGTAAQARTAAHLPRGNAARPEEPLLSRLPRPLPGPLRLHRWLFPAKFRIQGYLGPSRFLRV
ncbi:uncharacterized protein LOC141583528 [Saimiri boliviensis]|uniref:uncharacterized protein LOC141583528 n=1 Tax=Saimiri boliviensis TaxID=27679 RepID=UPI003D77C81F